jgi:FkbM family methyltransferase
MSIPNQNLSMAGIKAISVNGYPIRYVEHAAGWRYDTLSEKEPETVEWIDTFQLGETFWDVGANVGIYSIYAGVRGIRTMAFEPHFANYYQFCITIALNGLQDVVTPLSLAFAESKSIAAMNLASIDVGTSMSNFGAALDFRGQPFQPAFRQGMIGYDIDSFVADFGLPVPTHLKIDVDGLELDIVRGARRMLANPALQSVSIELIESDLGQVAEVTAIMSQAGLQFIHKRQNSAFATPQTRDVLNYLFHRDPALFASRRGGGTAPMEAPTVTPVDLIARIVDRIALAPIDPEPSGNIFMEDMLPPEVYRELIMRLPHDGMLDPIDHPDAFAPDGRRTRFLLDLTPASLARLSEEDRPFWEAMIEVFTAPEISRAIVAKFAPTLAERFGREMPELVAVPILYRDHPGYRIGVHPDAESKIATMQFYLPEDLSQRHLGTSFFRRNGDAFERLKTNAFIPNSAYAFVRTAESWHSVDELAATEKVRNSIALTFYIKGQEYRSKAVATPVSAPAAPSCNDRKSLALRELVRTFKRRDQVAVLFRKNGIGVELGVAAGDFSERILKHDHIGHLFSIDMWAGDRGHGIEQYREAIVRLDPYRARNTILRMRFDEALPLFDNESLDFIYVDGYAHDGEMNGQTFRDWFPKLRRGGIIAGDDYSPEWPLVIAAVNAFAGENHLEVHVIDCHEDTWNSKYPTWFALKP